MISMVIENGMMEKDLCS
uniref:Uncharacterized protein n=1 Tax=Rhizophora mucronata TaxID=61149 RepID=A0A2P2QRQ2_RHIMU